MTALAGLLHESGCRVTGSDGKLYPPTSSILKKLGLSVFEEFDASHLEPAPDLVVVGNAAFLSDFVVRQLAQVDGGFFAENLRFAENLIDWVSLDNELIAIRSRDVSGRRLRPVEKRMEITLEAVSYLLPLGSLIALAAALHYRRRNTVSMLVTAAGDGREEDE